MPRLRITILDLVTKGPTNRLFARVMNPNLASIMPQALAVWCEELGHEVRFVCYTGREDLAAALPDETDVLFIGAFTRSAQTAYAISNLYRKRGAITVLGGPHARSYPQDSALYFDYVLGFTDKPLIAELLKDGAPHRPFGRRMNAARQPTELPGVKERWKFIEPTIAKAPLFQVVPMIGSMGCPYTCSFCIDSVVDYQPMSFDQIREDLVFLQQKMKRPRVGWHDPNFGIRFNDYMGAIEDVVRPGKISFVAESSLSILSESNLKRLEKNGFRAILPGIESWYTMGNKSKTGRNKGIEKVRQIADHINLVLRHIPYVQTNFVLGLDCDAGPEPFELTKRFLELSPGAFPAFSLFTAYGQAAPMNLDLQREGRVLPFPFNFLDSNHAMNVKPKNYEWAEFYAHAMEVSEFSLSWPSVGRRFMASKGMIPRWLNAVRARSSSRVTHYARVRRMLDEDAGTRRFFAGESTEVPPYYVGKIKQQLGPLWEHLPEGAIDHDPNAYLKEHTVRMEEAARRREPAVAIPAE